MGFFPILLPIQSSYPFLQIPLWAWCRCLANLVVALDEDVLREGAHIVGFQKQYLVAEVEEGPIHPFFGELFFHYVQLVVGGDGEDLHRVLPLVVKVSQLRELAFGDGRHPIDELQQYQTVFEVGEADSLAVAVFQGEVGGSSARGEAFVFREEIADDGFMLFVVCPATDIGEVSFGEMARAAVAVAEFLQVEDGDELGQLRVLRHERVGGQVFL